MKYFVLIFSLIFSVGMAQTSLASIILGPSPYLSFNDSPFNGSSFKYFYLEDFEDGYLNTPGVVANKGGVGHGHDSIYADSVDGDDGLIDGSGSGGHSWALYNDINDYVSFDFNKNTLGALPTHAGIVWTDLHPGYGNVTFTAFGADGSNLGSISAFLGDGTTLGGTSEDRFFGVVDMGGVSRIMVSTTPGMTWEVDHLQYGSQVPIPETFLLFGSGIIGLLGIKKKRKDKGVSH